MNLKTIEIDLEVYKALENLRKNFDESPNDILKRVLVNTHNRIEPSNTKVAKGGLRIRDGVFLPAGTKLRHIAKRTGRRYDAIVIDGGIEFNGNIYQSPSMAAIGATNTHRNGWVFWEYQDSTTGEWQLLDYLRRGLSRVTI